MTASPTGLSIGQVARRTGLSVHTLRFYEREGLFADPVDRVGGRRVFSAEQVEWLRLCAALRASGMPVAAIRAYAGLVRGGEGTEPDRLELLREHRDRVSDQLRDLSRCLDLIAHKVRVYEDLSARGEPHDSCRAPALLGADDLSPSGYESSGPRRRASGSTPAAGARAR